MSSTEETVAQPVEEPLGVRAEEEGESAEEEWEDCAAYHKGVWKDLSKVSDRGVRAILAALSFRVDIDTWRCHFGFFKVLVEIAVGIKVEPDALLHAVERFSSCTADCETPNLTIPVAAAMEDIAETIPDYPGVLEKLGKVWRCVEVMVSINETLHTYENKNHLVQEVQEVREVQEVQVVRAKDEDPDVVLQNSLADYWAVHERSELAFTKTLLSVSA